VLYQAEPLPDVWRQKRSHGVLTMGCYIIASLPALHLRSLPPEIGNNGWVRNRRVGRWFSAAIFFALHYYGSDATIHELDLGTACTLYDRPLRP
jgi:hypothetical protein